MGTKVEKISKDAKRSRERLDQSVDDIRQQMERTFIRRVEANKQGNLGDVARGQ
jgi:hypothetical protein